ncbi:MAG TPA: stage II sporulation protein R [Clostridia bacterium]|nr:stage II sporulation protein R [Clostridia bacterium]HPZ53211.1 stage II sporulation protein R [Clostridia bacterium]
MKKVKHLLLVLVLIITAVCILNVYSNNVMEDLKGNLVRLHVVANSDNADDQDLKLSVRDSVVEYTNKILESCESSQEAYKILDRNLYEIERIARDAVRSKGYDYDVDVSLGIFEFPTKDYGNIILPNGEYTSLKITIGEGLGQNWWCVLFPPLCFVNANVNAVVNEPDADNDDNNREDGKVNEDEITEQGKEALKENLSQTSYEVIEKSNKGVKFKFKIIEVIENAKMKIQATFKRALKLR